MKLPKVRGFELIPYRDRERQGFLISDPLRLSGNTLFLPEPAAFIVVHFDGQKDFAELQENFYRKYGEILFRERVEEIIKILDQNFLLENERFHQRIKREEEYFRSTPIRSLFSLSETRQKAVQLKKRLREAVRNQPERNFKKAIVSPHIDFERGLEGYSNSYSCYKKLEGKTVIFLGTNHTPFGEDFILTRKPFETPWKVVNPDLEIIEELEKALSTPYQFELAHRFEHSIELNVVFLSALIEDFKIVPVLTPSFTKNIQEKKLPVEYEPFFSKLKEISRQEKIVLVAAVDLSHIGIRFGTGVEAIRIMEAVEKFDRKIIDKIVNADPDGFLQLFFENKNATNVCGTGPLYTLLEVIEEKGILLGYYKALDPDGSSAVTFTSILF